MRHLIKRLGLYFNFKRVLKRAREIELEYQRIEQHIHDVALDNQIYLNRKELELERCKGYLEGLRKALEIANK